MFKKFLLIGLILILVLGTVNAITDTNLIAYYKFDETTGTTLIDYVGYDNNCTTTATTTINQTGKIGKSYYYSGTASPSTNYSDCGDGSLDFTGIFSISSWVYPKNQSSDMIRFVISRKTTRESYAITYGGYNVGRDKPECLLGNATTLIVVQSSNSIPLNEWSHIACTWNGTTDTNAIKLYVNGVLSGQGTFSGTQLTTTNNTYIGANPANNNTDSYIDELGVWRRVLTGTDVNDLYNSGSGLTYPFLTPAQARITWNVYRTGTSSHLTSVSADCNVNTMDFTTQNSPVTGAYVDQNTNYSCVFSRTGYTDSSAQTGVVDSNKTVTVYLSDATNPSVGQTVANGFSINGSYISGSGIISATATDTGSGIETCEYTVNNGSSWVSADKNATHCYKSYSIPSDGSYTFNLRATDYASNTGTGTATITYYADATPPVTTFSSFQVSGTTDQNITLSCTDNNSGCKAINYNVNNEGWNTIVGLTPLEFDYNFLFDSTTYSTGGNYELQKTYYINNETFMSAYLENITASLKGSTQNGRTGCAKFNIAFSDGNTEWSEEQCSTSSSFSSKSFSITTQDKEVDYIQLWLYQNPAPEYVSQIKDINFSLMEYELLNLGNDNYVIYSGSGDHNIQYFSTDNVDNNETTKTDTFTTYGLAQFTLKDQNSSLDLDDVVWTVNPSIGGSSGGTITGDNQLDLNLQGITSTTYTFTFTKTGYSTRTYVADLTQLSEIDTNFALLPDSLDSDVPFKVYQTDETTLFTNTYVEVKDSDTNWTVGRKKTNSLGEVTFNLRADDSNYLIEVDNGAYTYQAVALTILYPKNEETLEQITEDWKVEITQNLYALYQDLNAPKIIYLLPNTALPFTIKISDMNGNYFTRTYTKQYPGNPLTDTLQPYLVSTETGLLTTIYTLDATTGNAVPGITIKIYKFISGQGRTLVEQITTDSKGQALTLLIINASYEMELYKDATFLEDYEITATGSQIYFYIDFGSTITPIQVGGYNATWSPTSIVKALTGTQTFLQTIFNPYGDDITVNAYLLQSDLNLEAMQTWTGTSTSHTFTFITDWADINSSITAKMIVIIDGNSYVFSKTYYLSDTFGTNYNILYGLQYGLRQDLTCQATGVCFPLLIIAVIASIGFGIYVSMLMGQIGSQSVSILFGILMALFTFLNWVPIELMGVIAIIIIAFMVNERR